MPESGASPVTGCEAGRRRAGQGDVGEAAEVSQVEVIGRAGAEDAQALEGGDLGVVAAGGAADEGGALEVPPGRRTR